MIFFTEKSAPACQVIGRERERTVAGMQPEAGKAIGGSYPYTACCWGDDEDSNESRHPVIFFLMDACPMGMTLTKKC